jgi:hypothetical protein
MDTGEFIALNVYEDSLTGKLATEREKVEALIRVLKVTAQCLHFHHKMDDGIKADNYESCTMASCAHVRLTLESVVEGAEGGAHRAGG